MSEGGPAPADSEWRLGRRLLIVAFVFAVEMASISVATHLLSESSRRYLIWEASHSVLSGPLIGVSVGTLIVVFLRRSCGLRYGALLTVVGMMAVLGGLSAVNMITSLTGGEPMSLVWRAMSTAHTFWRAGIWAWVVGVVAGRGLRGGPPSMPMAWVLLAGVLVPMVVTGINVIEFALWSVSRGHPVEVMIPSAVNSAVVVLVMLLTAVVMVAVGRGVRSLYGPAAVLVVGTAGSRLLYLPLWDHQWLETLTDPVGSVFQGVMYGTLAALMLIEAWPALRRPEDSAAGPGQ